MHRSFRHSLNDGHRAERQWVDRQRQDGLSVAHGRKLLLTKHDKANDHCGTPDAAVLMTVEIKERRLKFTCPEDYPYETVFVNAARSLEKESLHPFAYVFLSSFTGEWVWITPLDRDETWTEQTVRDTTRGHDMGMLVAPKKFLRPSSQLTNLLVPHRYLEVVDGDTALFREGGGEVEERERFVAETDPSPRGRGRKTESQDHWNVG